MVACPIMTRGPAVSYGHPVAGPCCAKPKQAGRLLQKQEDGPRRSPRPRGPPGCCDDQEDRPSVTKPKRTVVHLSGKSRGRPSVAKIRRTEHAIQLTRWAQTLLLRRPRGRTTPRDKMDKVGPTAFSILRTSRAVCYEDAKHGPHHAKIIDRVGPSSV